MYSQFFGAGQTEANQTELASVQASLDAMMANNAINTIAAQTDITNFSPYTIDQVRMFDTRPSQEAFKHCNTILLADTSFSYIEFYPKPGQPRGVQIDLDL